MKTSVVAIDGRRLSLHSLNTLVVGSGAAALNAAVRLWDFGQRDIAVVTEDFGGGTSANAGSDKQTYYKLSLAGDRPDSPYDMARDLLAGGCMHGDIALCEAVGSAAAFHHLVELGVPFPHDRFGATVGYKTDHDPRQRATSAGPLTSRLMFEALARAVRKRRIRVFDRHPVVALLTAGADCGKKVIGAIALDAAKTKAKPPAFVLFNAVNIVLGTGGPAGLYEASVYPESQTGGHGLAFSAGAVGHNLTESQFGLASVQFRWNLSGTYQQVVPRYVSVDRKGRSAREFLNDHFPDMAKLATAIFLKGYQWPFDPRKVAGFGSSLIDLLVYHETVERRRRVFLDFRHNPSGAGRLEDFSFETLAPEARTYLERSGATQPTPFERLKHMNPPAIEVYRSHGIDLERERLEIAVCAQHNNGGLKSDLWWESNIRHLFPVGEVNGTHGVTRPGGSALNAGQVGSLRAALRIARRYAGRPPAEKDFLDSAAAQVRKALETARSMTRRTSTKPALVESARAEIRRRMTACGAHVRPPAKIADETAKAWAFYRRVKSSLRVASPAELPAAFKTLDLALTHVLYLEAIREYIEKGGASRGSYLVLDPAGDPPGPGLPADWKYKLARPDDFAGRKILEMSLDEAGRVRKEWVDIRPLPPDEGWFETVWGDFRNGRIFG
jgi:succinate dehydrogenase/fumarate reductase flavoprotein subunit